MSKNKFIDSLSHIWGWLVINIESANFNMGENMKSVKFLVLTLAILSLGACASLPSNDKVCDRSNEKQSYQDQACKSDNPNQWKSFDHADRIRG